MGKFIVIEGIDGSGKSTQVSLLCDKLQSLSYNVFKTAEPTSSPCGNLIRQALRGEIKCDSYELASLFLADRINHNVNPSEGILHFLDMGAVVISDRYYYSSLAYQGMDADFEWVKNINLTCSKIAKPDLCIFLDLPPESSMDRIKQNRESVEIFEQEDLLSKIRDRFFYVFDRLKCSENIAVIDASRDIDSISNDILKRVLEIL